MRKRKVIAIAALAGVLIGALTWRLLSRAPELNGKKGATPISDTQPDNEIKPVLPPDQVVEETAKFDELPESSSKFEHEFEHEFEFENKQEFRVSLDDGIFSAGASEPDVKDQLIMNFKFTPKQSNHIYGIQIMNDPFANGMLALHTETGTAYLSQMEYERGTAQNPGELMLLGRTWDQQMHQEYKGTGHLGLVWTLDDPSTKRMGATMYVKLCDLSSNEVVDMLEIRIQYKYGVYRIKSVDAHPVCEFYVEDQTNAQKQLDDYISSAAIALIREGILFQTSDKVELKKEDVIVQNLPDLWWCEVADLNGGLISKQGLSLNGDLFSATVKHVNDTIGAVTVYYDVSYDFDLDTGELSFDQTRPTIVGYDFYGERTWEDFCILNGYTNFTDSERMQAAKSFQLYRPDWLPSSAP